MMKQNHAENRLSAGKLEADETKSLGTDNMLSLGTDNMLTFATIPFCYPDPYGTLLAFCVPQASNLTLSCDRVPLPREFSQDEPIYVNAKQYHAILRRRELRAKFEAQRKISKIRKPYLHESRHLHAIKRARESSGRFLNTKKQEDSKKGSNVYHHKHHESYNDSSNMYLDTKSIPNLNDNQQEIRFSDNNH